jgi:hypothetical protein
MPAKPRPSAGAAEAAPEARSITIRSAIVQALSAEELTARELSARVGIAERDVAGHLEHLEHSLLHIERRLAIAPPGCVACGYRFESRSRRTRPSRCPRCRSERIDPARFRIVEGSRASAR